MRRRTSLPTVFLLLIVGAVASRPAVAEETFQPEPFPAVRASAWLPETLRQGAHHAVQEEGKAEAFFTRWNVESPYGLFACPSRRLLEVRVREIEAMATLVDSAPENEVLKGLQAGLKEIPTVVIQLIDDPVGTIEGAAKGVERTLGRVGDLFGGRKKSRYEKDNEVEGFLFAAEKRKVAFELGVDVYSSNPKLQSFLDGIARARRGGAFAVDIGKMFVPGMAGTAVSGLSMTADMGALLRDSTPAELDRFSDEKMTKAGIMPELRRRFLANRALSPRHRTSISTALAALDGVRNRGALISAANETQTEAQAFLHEQQAFHLVHQHEKVEALAALDATGGVVAAFTTSGKMVVPLPIDVLVLTDEVRVVAEALRAMPGAAEAPTRTLRLTGRATPKAKAWLAAQGFDVVEDARLDAPTGR